MLKDLTQGTLPRPIPFLVFPVAAFEILRALLMFWVVIAPTRGETTHVIPQSWIQMATLNPLFSLEPEHAGPFLFLMRHDAVESTDPRINALIGLPLGAFVLLIGIGILCRSPSAAAAAAGISAFTVWAWIRAVFIPSGFQDNVQHMVQQILFTSEQTKSNFYLALLFNLVISCYLAGEPVAYAFMPRPMGPRRNF